MSINAGSVYAELILKAEKFFETLNQADREMSTLEKNFKNYGDKMEKAGKAWSTKVSAPIAGVGIIATKLGLDFESAMSEVGAISGATGDELIILEKKARDMGATTKFSASDAADALKYMAMAGWETHQMLDGIDGVMALAAASGEDLGLVSDIVTDALTAFGMEARQAGEFADLLASASSNSNTNVAMMGETFKYVAPLFGALGYSAEDAALATGLMANAGIKGSQAGTSLRAAVTNLMKPTDSMAIAMEKLGISVTDTNDEMLPFKDLMDVLRVSFADLTEEQQAQYAATIFGKEAMSGMLAIINASEEDYEKLTKATKDYSGAAEEMADIMQDNLKGRWQEFKSAIEEVALQIYDLLLPSLERWLEKGKQFIDWFSALDEGSKKTILRIGGIAAAIGPLLIVGGKMANGIGSIIGLFSKFSGAASAAAKATTATAKGIGLAGGAAKAGALLLNPWTIGIAAAGVGAVALTNHLRKDVVPAFELFDETISESTREALGNFLDLEKEATAALNSLAWSGATVTEDMKNSIVGNTNEMADEVISKLEEQKIEGLKQLEEFLAKATELSEEEKEEALRIAEERYDGEIERAREGKARIEEILEEAKENNRAITEEEKQEITKIIEEMKNDSIKLMTENEEEQEKILNKLKENAERITLEMASEVIKNSIEQKEKTIENAKEQYEGVVAAAEKMREEGTEEAIALADKMIEEAERQRDETVKTAEDMHDKVLKEIENQGKDIIHRINLDNGEIKKNWDALKDWFMKNPIVRKIVTAIKDHNAKGGTLNEEQRKDFREGVRRRYAHGTNYHPGGYAWVGEQGPEIVELPRGSKVYTNQESMNMMGGKLELSGTVTVEGINSQGEFISAADYTIEEVVKEVLRKEVRS